ncbi:putative negative transcriptional regulator [Podospora australis]|uniref:Negative transcriptional regulator n=1 Tax=Podospora australis TaxID=1536484 RepID=A0AAN6WLH4_9PEZI|nr:putative negative transcriptional regulator [Podospora australis]
MSKSLLITGATGKQGGAVIDALLADLSVNQWTILAVTRNSASPAAQKLAARSPQIKLVEGNLDDVPALFEAAKRANNDEPIWGVYSVQVSMGPGVTVEGEVKQGNALIDGAIEAGVKHFVYSSVERGGDGESWDNPTPIPHFQSKQRIETHLRTVTEAGEPGGGMGWTILRPVAFMDNLTPGFPTKVFMAALRNWLGDNKKKLQWVATADIGVFAAKAFADPQHWNRKAVGLAGDELTVDELSKAFAKATGNPAPITYWFFGSALTYAVREMGLMIGWFASDGYKADIQARRKEVPSMLTMEQWLATRSGFAKNK